MKNILKLTAILLLVLFNAATGTAQEERNKIVMTVNNGGKNITTELGTVNYNISRYDYGDSGSTVATTTVPTRGNFYLSLTLKNVSNDMLKVIAKKDSKFSGTITITDTYGKNPPREIKFTNAAMESYADQYSSSSYDDSYAIAAMTLSCTSMTINGVLLE